MREEEIKLLLKGPVFNNNIMIAQDAGSTTGKILLGAAVDGETGDAGDGDGGAAGENG